MKKRLLLSFLVSMLCTWANAQLSVFSDSYGAGATFVAFGGSTNSVSVDNTEFNTGTSSLRVDVPASGYTGGALVAAAGQNLSSYNAISFWVKASASKTLNVSGICNNSVAAQYGAEYNNLAVNTTWRQYIIPIPDASKLTAEDGLFHFAEGSDQGAYTIWFDDIEYVNSPAVGTFSPSIGSQTVSRPINGTFNVFGQVLNVLVNGSNQTINVALASFDFISSNAAVATVSSTGTITAVGAGSAIITATLSGVTATGSVTMNVSAAPAAPTVAAPVPTMSSANVISLFSNTYTNIGGINWFPNWGQSTIVTDILVAGNTTKKYENLNYQGVEFATPVDASTMQFLHLDIWTPNCTSFEVFLINNAPAPTVEQRVVITPTLAGWNSIDIPLTSYNTIALNRINQIKLVGTPFGSSQVYLDNIYFYFDPNTPAIAAPTPTTPAPNVISIYSGAYTNLAGTNFNPNWGQSTVATEVMVAGNATRKYANLNYQGIEFAAPVDASGMQTLHLDVWTPNCTAFEVFLINAGPVERGYTVTPTLSGWNSIEIPLSAYTPTINLSSIIQIKFVGTPFSTSQVFVDNIYFYTVPSAPLAAAPTPTHSAANVISLFSNAYTDLAGTNWNPNWGQSTVVTDVQILGNDTKRYDNLNYQGVQFASAIDATGMQFLHLDLWTSNCTSFEVVLISSGPVERGVTVTPTALGWNSYNIPLSSFSPTVNLSDIIQIKFVGVPSGTCQVYLDNIYFYTIPNTPTVAAPTPTHLAANVISLFSNAYTNVAGTDWFPNWGQSTQVTDIQVAGNDTKRYTNLNYQGVQFASPINASSMQYLHLDLWTTNCTALQIFLINAGGLEVPVTVNPTALGWNSFDIPLSSYAPVNLSSIIQFKFDATPRGSSRVFLDNIFFYTDPNTPITAAPTPTTPSADVISLFSNAYTNVTGTDWFPNWGQSTVVTDVQIAGNATKKYENLNYQGVVFSNPIDASGMQYLHLDVWTPNCTAFEVFLINPGPTERGYTVTPTLSGWNSINIPLSAYTPAINLSNIFQLKLVGTPSGTSTVFLDNVYFFTVPSGPTVAAPTPTTPAPNVISLYSNAYTNVTGTDWFPNWGQSTVVTDILVAGNDTKKYENLNYQGVVFSNSIDASNMQFLHVDIWTPNCTAFEVFLINPGPTERGYTVTPTLSGWNSVNIPLSAFSPTINLSNIFQLKFVGTPSGTSNVFLDNIYFYTIPTAPLVAAPTPTTPSADVISLFSNDYTNVPGTDWFPNWGQSTQVTDVLVAGNDTKRYTNLNYQGVQFASSVDASAMQILHLDLWTTNCTAFEVFLVNTSPGTVEQRVVINPTLYGWNSIDIPLSSYSAINLSNIGQIKLVGTPFGTSRVFLDNIYFYKELTPVATAGNISCNGGTTSVTVTAFGGAGTYSGTGTFVRSAGTHTFTVTDANGTIATTSVVISQPSVLTASAMAETVTCLSPTANVTVSANGGTSPYANVGVFGRTPGAYSFTVTDANGCSASQSVNVSQNLAVTAASITSSNGTGLCPGQSTNLIALPSGNQYRWNTNATTQSITVNTLSAFRVTVTYPNSACTSTASVTVTAQVDNTPPTISCPADNTVNGVGTAYMPNYVSTLTATDNCATNVVITQSPAAGTAYTATNSVNVTITANDGNGNRTTCTFVTMVNVAPGPVFSTGGDNTCNFRYFWPQSGAVVGSTNASTSCYSLFGNNVGTNASNEPTDCGTAGDKGVWYFFRMPGCGTSSASPLGVKISTNNAGTALAGTNLAVYSVTNPNSCTGAGYANIGCSNNSTVTGCNGTAGTSTHGTLEFGPGKPNGPLMANGDYFIYVSGDNGAEGNFELSFEYTGDRNINVAAGATQTQAMVTVPNNGQGSFKPQWRPMGSTGWASVNGLVTGNTFTLPVNSLMPGVNYEFRALYACASTFNYVMASNVVNFATTPNVSSCGPVTGLTCNAVAGNVTTTWNAAPAGTTGNLVVVARSGSRQLVGTVAPSTATGVTLTCAGCTATNTSFTLQSTCGGSAYIASGNCAVSAAGQAATVQTVSFEHNGIVYEDVDFNDPSWGLFGAQPEGDFEMSVDNGQLIINDVNATAVSGFDFELRPSVAIDFTNVVISTEKAVDAQLSLSDMNGTVINTRTLKQVQNGTVVTLETSELPTGLYIVSVRTEEGNVAKKLVKIN